MTKYLFNSNIHGYELATIKEFNKDLVKDDLIILIIDKSSEADSSLYYKLVDGAIRSQSRVILISVDDNNSLFDVLASNMIVYKEYDIYQVVNKEAISADYLLKVQDRTPDLTEAQAFLNTDIVAYNDICNILYGIESLVNEGNIDGLKAHVERHIPTIEGLVYTINKMKKAYDASASNEFLDMVNSLKMQIESLNGTIADKNKDIDDIKHNRDEYKVQTENLKREITKLKNNPVDVSASSETTKNVIKSYTAFNTSLHANNKAIVIYFKEVSYVRFTNTLVSILMKVLEKKKLKCKLLIYDNNTNMVANYGLDVINGDYYASNKMEVLKKKIKMVVTEPFQSIIQDMIASNEAADVVIIYDRLKQYEDIVKGNNVTKFFIVNSRTDVKNIIGVKALGVDDTESIITNATNTFKFDNNKEVKFLDIPVIDTNFSSLTESAQINKYIRLRTTITDVLLLETIMNKAHISK